MKRRRMLLVTGGVLLGAGGLLLGQQGYLEVKAMLAAKLLERAFAEHLEDGGRHPPWSGADMAPIARLEVERLGLERYVLSGATGESMSFGVGHMDGTALPGRPGNCVLAGHRDTWLAFLRDLRPGEALRVITREGTRRYRLESTRVVHGDDGSVLEQHGRERLTLITCYPFDGLLRSPLRFVAVFRPELRRA